MKHTVFRLLALALTIVLALPLLASCAQEKPVLRYKDYSLSREIFAYQCAMDKTTYLYEAYGTTSDKTPSSQLQDNPAIWSYVDDDGNTVADNLKKETTEKMKWLLYLEQVAKDKGYTLSAEDKEKVKGSLDSLVAKNFKTKSEFNKAMKDYGINYDEMYEYYLHQALASRGSYLLFGESGEMEISEEDARKYYNENYISVGCIFINNQNKTYPNGKTVFLPENEKAEKTALADEVYRRLEAGEDFFALYREFSDQKIDKDGGEIFTFAKGGFGNEEAENAAFALAVDEMTRVDTDRGIFILYRRNLNASYFETVRSSIESVIEENKKQQLLAAAGATFSVDQEYIDNLDIANMEFVR